MRSGSVSTIEITPEGRWRGGTRVMVRGDRLTFGRAADIAIGIDDAGVSGVALAVTVTSEGWEWTATNRNGTSVQAWGHSPRPGRPREFSDAGLVAVQLHGTVSQAAHWVVLEAERGPTMTRPPHEPGSGTETARQPRPLTEPQLDAIHAVFAELVLVWPPTRTPVPRELGAAARRIGLSETGLKDRLRSVREKAVRLGCPASHRLGDPCYVETLAARGYLPQPRGRATDIPLGPTPVERRS